MRRHLPVLLVAFALGVSACGVTGVGDEVPRDGAADDDGGGGAGPAGDWRLTSGTSQGSALPIPEGGRITLTVEGGQVGGTAACNSYFSELTRDGETFVVGQLGATEMACEQPLMDAEAAYLAALPRVERYRIEGGALVLSGREDTTLRFERLEPPPTRALVGTTWTLDTLIRGEAASSARPATLVLTDDGRLEGSTGCRRLTGSWAESGDELTTPELSVEGDCGPRLADQDEHVIGVLEGGFRAAVDGNHLTLTGRDGDGLRYTAEPAED